MISPVEREILARAVVLDPGPDDFHRIRSCISSDLALNRLIDTAIREGLGGHLYRSFKRSGVLEILTESEKEKLETHYYQVVRHNLRLIHALKEILHQSHRKSINVIRAPRIEDVGPGVEVLATFEDHPEPEKRRHLLRLWLSSDDGPALPAVFDNYTSLDARGRPMGLLLDGVRLNAPLEREDGGPGSSLQRFAGTAV